MQLRLLPGRTWIRRLVADLSPLRPWFSPELVHVRFVVDQVAPGQVFLRIFRSHPVGVTPPLFHFNFFI
jgi:hypothetical protein